MKKKGEQDLVERRAARIVGTMPELPSPDDPPRVQAARATQYRAWIEGARRQVSGDEELSALVMDAMRHRMGLDDPDPVRAAETTRELLAAGMGEIGMTARAIGAVRRAGLDDSAAAGYLIDQYVRVWIERGEEMPVGLEIDDGMLIVGQRDALRVNVWISGEPGTSLVAHTIRENDL